MSVTRRDLILGAGAALASTPSFATARSFDVVATARRLVAENRARIGHVDVAAVLDFAAPSWRPRFHVVELASGAATAFLVAHGRGSDPLHTGWLKQFSNAPGSNATSRGAYRTGGLYDGKYGRSMRLVGLDSENSNAEARAIVVHPAWYVSRAMLRDYGKLGRSEGCFALSAEDHAVVMERLGQDRLLFAGKFS